LQLTPSEGAIDLGILVEEARMEKTGKLGPEEN
jgi:hypothetical protein